VSTVLQKEDRQIIALKEFGVDEKNIFLDKMSGKDFNRPNYKRLLKKLRKGDVLVIKSIDRLGRDYNEIVEHWRRITKEIKASFVVLDLPILDTRMKNKYDLTGILISDVVLALFGYVSQMERENLLVRQAEGIAVAKEKGIRFGRPPKEKPDNTDEYIAMYKAGDISLRKAAEALGVPKSTFEHWVKEL
jgi:DNA invertase Pin-like site-specific DNA recombinase